MNHYVNVLLLTALFNIACIATESKSSNTDKTYAQYFQEHQKIYQEALRLKIPGGAY